MEKFADRFTVKSSRLQSWNYSSPGIYFITTCTYCHNNFFGKIVNRKMVYSKCGQIANRCLIDIPKHFPNVRIIESLVMPNHLHLLLEIKKFSLNHHIVETHHDASLHKKYDSYYFHRIAIHSTQTIPLVIKQFKSSVKRICNQHNLFFSWQSRYYDEIVVSPQRLFTVKRYIQRNPENWSRDEFYLK